MANNTQYPAIQHPRPPVAPMGPQNTYPTMSMQFRPVGPPRPPPPYMPMAAQQFLPVGRPNIGLPSQSHQLQLSQPVQHLPPRPGPPVHSMVPPPPPPPAPQAFSLADGQPSRPMLSVSPQAGHAVPIPNNYVPGPSGPRVSLSSTYNTSTSATTQVHINAEATSQYQSTSLISMPSFPLGASTWSSDGQTTKAASVTPVLQSAEQTSVAPSNPVTTDPPKTVEKAPSDWIEHTARTGKRYYHNKKTKLSTWEKPVDLMSPIERADACTNWKEYIAPDGRKYYYNKVTMQSKWRIPDELKLAREQVKIKSTTEELTKDPDDGALVPPVTGVISSTASADSPTSPHELMSSPIPVAPVTAGVQSGSVVTSELSKVSIESSKVTANAAEESTVPATLLDSDAPALSNTEDASTKDAESGTPVGNNEESEKSIVTNNSANIAVLEGKTVDHETQVYENKQAFAYS